jgi:hypothetical protein
MSPRAAGAVMQGIVYEYVTLHTEHSVALWTLCLESRPIRRVDFDLATEAPG